MTVSLNKTKNTVSRTDCCTQHQLDNGEVQKTRHLPPKVDLFLFFWVAFVIFFLKEKKCEKNEKKNMRNRKWEILSFKETRTMQWTSIITPWQVTWKPGKIFYICFIIRAKYSTLINQSWEPKTWNFAGNFSVILAQSEQKRTIHNISCHVIINVSCHIIITI